VRILVVGDSYLPSEAFREGLSRLAGAHELDYLQIDATRQRPPADASEARLREYEGSPDEIVEHLAGHEVLVVHGAPVSERVLAGSPKLRLICCARGGPVNVDLAAASARGVPVTTTPGKNAAAVVELTLAFLVMLARGVSPAQRFLLDGGVLGASAFEGAQFFGRELSGRTLGLVGYGNVGRRVAAVAGALGMRVLVHDPHVDASAFDPSVERVALPDLLGRSEFLSLHARASTENDNLVDAAAFAALPRGAFLVNTARETLVDEDALLGALRSGQVAGAALDVVRDRPDRTRNPLLDESNVVMTPHIGGATAETLERGVEMVADEIERFVAGEPLLYVRA
jgi:D-3-phosphoglycerate dehydrogenase